MQPFGAPQYLEKYRIQLEGYPLGDSQNGAFLFPNGVTVIISNGGGWEHASISRRSKIPTYHDVARVRRIFWGEHVTVVQYFVPASEHINVHPYCLHLWRPMGFALPRPPGYMVG